jgi:hypothetical protein
LDDADNTTTGGLVDGFVALGFKWVFSNLIAGPSPPEAEAEFGVKRTPRQVPDWPARRGLV